MDTVERQRMIARLIDLIDDWDVSDLMSYVKEAEIDTLTAMSDEALQKYHDETLWFELGEEATS